MLTLMLGRAGSGKTSRIFSRISQSVRDKKGGNILIVPEQYSHDAERELSSVCPDSASLYAEVLSFSRLSSRVLTEVGGSADKVLDNAGRILAMSRALAAVSPQLRIYSLGANRPDYLQDLISAYDELRSANADVLALYGAAAAAQGSFAQKLSELSLIFTQYETVKEQSGIDSRDRLDRLADGIERSSVGDEGHIYIDGFTDFTAQELRVIDRLLKKGADITVSLTTDSIDPESQAFHLSAETARGLMAAASRRGVELKIENCGALPNKAPELIYMERVLLDPAAEPYEGENTAVRMVAADSVFEECSAAAARAVELCQNGSRWRDIAIVSPDWDRYASVAASVFSMYGVPVNNADKTDILQKPVLALVLGALDIIQNGWDYQSIFRYLKTGLSGVTTAECDELENYVLKWNIRGRSLWTRADGWSMHPEGYSETMSDDDAQRLQNINAIRLKVAESLASLEDSLKNTEKANEKLEKIYDLCENIGLYGTLENRVAELSDRGELELASEYSQIWSILLGALTQMADILADEPISTEELISLTRLTLSQYQVGTIPTSVDAVGVGPMSRMRGRGIKHLILMGASDTALPSFPDTGGIFTEQEKLELRDLGILLPDPEEDSVYRELSQVYNSLTMPSKSLMFTYPSAARRSYILARLIKLLGIKEETAGRDLSLWAEDPAFLLAATVTDESDEAQDARQYFRGEEAWREKLNAVDRAASMPRGRLSKLTAQRLYGKDMDISASRVDRFYSCRYSYFLQYGLRVKPRRAAGLDVMELGTYTHFILEKVVSQVEKRGGFAKVTDEELQTMAEEFSRDYAETKLGGLEDKTGRFRYLFSRLVQDSRRIVVSMAEELRNSDFKPIDFELRFARNGEMPPVRVESEFGAVNVSGIVDRVDGWVHDDKLYLRVVDYKTGKRSFSLSDLWYGMGMQMALYLMTLSKTGQDRYLKEIVPAGVLYTPAREVMLQADSRLTEDEVKKARLKTLRRSGLLLDDPDVIAAMDTSGEFNYLPVKVGKDGGFSGESLAALERLGAMFRRVEDLLKQMGDQVRSGSINADPYFRSQMDTACTYCDYYEACRFGTGREDKQRMLKRIATPAAWQMMEEAAKENG